MLKLIIAESSVKWRPTDGLLDLLPGRKQKENYWSCKDSWNSKWCLQNVMLFTFTPFSSSGITLAGCGRTQGAVISYWHSFVCVTQFHIYSWNSLHIINSLWLRREQCYQQKRKSWSKQKKEPQSDLQKCIWQTDKIVNFSHESFFPRPISWINPSSQEPCLPLRP